MREHRRRHEGARAAFRIPLAQRASPLQESYRRLLLAVLTDAIAWRYGHNPEKVAPRARRAYARDARRWIDGDPDGALSFSDCCAAVGLDSSALRKRLRSRTPVDVRALYRLCGRALGE